METKSRVIISCKAYFAKTPSTISKQLKELNITSSEDEDLTTTDDINFYLDRVEMSNRTDENNTTIHFYSGKSIVILVDFDKFETIMKENKDL